MRLCCRVNMCVCMCVMRWHRLCVPLWYIDSAFTQFVLQTLSQTTLWVGIHYCFVSQSNSPKMSYCDYILIRIVHPLCDFGLENRSYQPIRGKNAVSRCSCWLHQITVAWYNLCESMRMNTAHTVNVQYAYPHKTHSIFTHTSIFNDSNPASLKIRPIYSREKRKTCNYWFNNGSHTVVNVCVYLRVNGIRKVPWR